MPPILKLTFVLVGWAAALALVLSIANWPGDWGHALCGPWGCGPPLQALLACHLAWLVTLAPPAVLLVRSPRVPTNIRRRIGTALCLAGAVILVGLVARERATWWPTAGEWQRNFFWQRCGFVLATTVDVPIVQLLLIGTYLRVRRLTHA